MYRAAEPPFVGAGGILYVGGELRGFGGGTGLYTDALLAAATPPAFPFDGLIDVP